MPRGAVTPMLLVPAAAAHAPGLSSLRVDGTRISMVYARGEVEGFTPFADVNESRLLIIDSTIARASLRAGGMLCALDEPEVRAVEGDGVEVRASFHCPVAGAWTWSADYLQAMDPAHRQTVEVNGAQVGLLSSEHRVVTFDAVPDTSLRVAEFVQFGVHHIWTGYDHLAFLAALLLTAGALRDMLFVVTGFTIAHSITLTLAVTGVFTLPPVYVEPAIAASIVFVGAENLLHPPLRRRVWLTFLLGLIHGFGFAGLLVDLGLPQSALAVALVSFNVGVELGQAAIVAVALPLLLLLTRTPRWRDRTMPALSLCIAGAGLYWFFLRVFPAAWT